MSISAAPGPVLDLADELEDLGLDRDVEGRRRLVGDEQLRVARQRHRDHDPLAHAARHLVRVLLDPAFGVGDPDRLERLDRLVPGRLLRQALVEDDRLGDLVADGEHRVEARSSAPGRSSRCRCRGPGASPPRSGASRSRPSNRISPVGDLGRRHVEQAHDRQRRHALAAARLADDAQRLAGHDREADAVDGPDGAVHDVEVGPQVADLEQRSPWHRRRRPIRPGAGPAVKRSLLGARVQGVAQAVAHEVDAR